MPNPENDCDSIHYRPARPADGAAMWRLVRDAGTLELNSAYFYLVFASDFGNTCLIAELNGCVVGAVIGYRPPREPQAAFVWQVGVVPTMRGKGLGRRLLQQWLELPEVCDAKWLTATISADNQASVALFRSAARDLGVGCEDFEHFPETLFPASHPAERLYRVGPLLDRRTESQHLIRNNRISA